MSKIQKFRFNKTAKKPQFKVDQGSTLMLSDVVMLLTALVQPHWVSTDVWHELEPQYPCIPVSPLLSVSALLSSEECGPA